MNVINIIIIIFIILDFFEASIFFTMSFKKASARKTKAQTPPNTATPP